MKRLNPRSKWAHRLATAVLVAGMVALSGAVASCGGEVTPDTSSKAPEAGRPPAAAQTGAPVDLQVVSNLNVAAGPEQITDLWAHTAASGRAYAYLGTYDMPSCGRDITGVHIVDMTDAARPVKAGFLASPPGTRVSDVVAGHVESAFFRGDILVFSVELCTGRVEGERVAASPGIVLYDITDPLSPRRLAPDFSLGFEAHNTFIYQRGDRAYVLVVRDDSPKDLVIVEITNPSSPATVFAGGWRDWLGPEPQTALGSVPASFLHDIWARSYPASHQNPSYAGKTVAYLSYWDAGLILLDITDPANPVFLGDSDYLDPDPLTGKPAEGNSHSAVPTEDGSLVFMGDEDFTVFRTVFTVDSGDFAGTYRTAEARFTPRLSQVGGGAVSGQAVFIGRDCAAADIPPPPRGSADERFIALIERDDCPFEEKVSNAALAGYDAVIVFSGIDTPDEVIAMRGAREKGKVPAFMVSRSTAFAVLGISPASPKDTLLPPVGTAGERITLKSDFDGWGYGRILDVRDPKNIVEVGRYATKEALLNPPPPGDHSMHNVVIEGRRAYISWYADGIRVVDFSDPGNPREVARFVDGAKGSDFWGVYLYRHPDGNTYILGSDRSTGLWVFRRP